MTEATDFPAAITKAEAADLADLGNLAANYRVALTLLSRSSRQIRRGFDEQGDDVFADAIEAVDGLRQQLRGITAVADAAAERLRLV